jgi:DNA-binding LytR/AlgR family response regulator
MKPVNVVIVEDNAVIAEGLESNLQRAGFNVAARFSAGEELVAQIAQLNADVILMDIDLAGDLDGIQTAERVRTLSSAAIIYITDYHDEHTVNRAKHTEPAHYLVKPYKIHDVKIAIEMAFHKTSLNKSEGAKKEHEAPDAVQAFPDRIFIKENDVLHRVDLNDLLWIKAEGSYCEVRTVQRKFMLAIPMGMFHEKFTHPHLVRVHRSYVVNIDKVNAIKGNELFIRGAEETIMISEKYKDQLDKLLPRI